MDELSTPLGQKKTGDKRRFKLPIAVPRVIAGALVLFLVVFGLWIVLQNDPLGGEPVIVVAAEPRVAAQPGTPNSAAPSPTAKPEVTPANPTAAAAPAKTPPGSSQTVSIIDGSTGRRQDVVVGTNTEATPGQPKTIVVDQRLADTSRHGTIPKIGPDGAKPSEVYAQPLKTPAGKVNAPRIALVITGLGISANVTSEALAKLPGPVTLAFMPYGADLGRWIDRARGEGHEVLLQVPMEPFDYPDNDPGPQTLLTTLGAEQNVDRLQWFMSRMQGYVGVTNFSGARFTSNEQTFAPVLREVAKRGLLYFDDGSSPRSFASQIAGSNKLPFAKADVVIDAVTTPAEIDKALARLEAAARERGMVVGVASALPVSIARIAQWAKAAEARGILLVPISEPANKAKQS